MNPLGTAHIIDAHVHVWDVPRPQRPYPWTPDPYPVELLLEPLDATGIDRAVLVTPSIMAFDNDYGVAVARAQPSRFGVFGRFDPTAPDVRGRLARWMAHDEAQGIRLTFFGPTAATPGTLLALGELWASCEELGVPVALLAPDALGEVAEVARRHPSLRLVVDHLGLGVYEGSPDPFLGWSLLPKLAAQPNVSTKISTLVEASRQPYPFVDVHDRLAEAVNLFGVERLIWASNAPVVTSACSYAQSLTFLGECAFLSGDDLEWLTHRSWNRFILG